MEESDNIDLSSELPVERSNIEEEDEVYLALHHGSGKLGGAFYNVTEGILYVINDLVDPLPQCRLVLAILTQLSPKYLLVSSRHHDVYDKAVQDLNETGSTSAAEKSSTLQDSTLADMSTKLNDYFPNMTIKILSPKEFGLESGRRRVYSQRLPGESQDQSAEDHHLMIHSLINQVRSPYPAIKSSILTKK